MIAITPPKIFSKEVAQNRPPHFLARTSLSTRNRFTANFQGWGLNQSSNFARPPHRGAGPHIQLRDQHKNGQCFLQPTSLEMRCTVPVPSPSDLATFRIHFAICFRTLRSVALSIFGRPSFTPLATARLNCLYPLANHRPLELAGLPRDLKNQKGGMPPFGFGGRPLLVL